MGFALLVGAGALVPPGMEVPARTLVLGVPARVVRPLSAEERELQRQSGEGEVPGMGLQCGMGNRGTEGRQQDRPEQQPMLRQIAHRFGRIVVDDAYYLIRFLFDFIKRFQ